MKDNDCRKYRFAVPLRQQLRQGVLVRLRSSDGLEGWGQAMPHSGVLTAANEAEVAEVALDAARSDLASQQAGMPLCDWLRQTSSYEPSGDAEKIPSRHGAQVSPIDTIRTAIVSSKKIPSRHGAPVSPEAAPVSPEAARISPRAIPVNALISGAAQTAEDVAKTGKLAAEAGFPAVKLKVGNRKLEDDIARVRALREAVGSEIAIRLDANGSWSPSEALPTLHSLMPFDIEYVEEPISAVPSSNNLATIAEPSNLTALADIASRSPIPVAADESISSVTDLSRLPKLGIPVVVIKPAVLGNLCELFAASQILLDEGVKVVVSSALDTSIGIACAAHFAAALGLNDTPCGLATAQWLADDLAEHLKIADGQISLPSTLGSSTPGLGFTPKTNALKRLCSLFEESATDVT